MDADADLQRNSCENRIDPLRRTRPSAPRIIETRKSLDYAPRRYRPLEIRTVPAPHVIVIGGGLAGLSASVSLSDAGYRVSLIERAPRLGGRATSYILPDDTHIDNCQHVTMRCCTNLEDFYSRVAVSKKIHFYNS